MYVVIDFETTGTFESQYFPTPIEIGAIKLNSKLEIVGKFQSLIFIDTNKVSDFIVNYTGIKKEELVKAPLMGDVFHNFKNFCVGNKNKILAWPISFEMPILQHCYCQLLGYKKFPLDRRGIDIGSIAYKWSYKNLKHSKLRELEEEGFSMRNFCDALEIEPEEPVHRALPDVETEVKIMRKIW